MGYCFIAVFSVYNEASIHDEFKWLAYDMIHSKYSLASDCEQVKSEKLHLSIPLNELLLLIVFQSFHAICCFGNFTANLAM